MKNTTRRLATKERENTRARLECPLNLTRECVACRSRSSKRLLALSGNTCILRNVLPSSYRRRSKLWHSLTPVKGILINKLNSFRRSQGTLLLKFTENNLILGAQRECKNLIKTITVPNDNNCCFLFSAWIACRRRNGGEVDLTRQTCRMWVSPDCSRNCTFLLNHFFSFRFKRST